MARAPLPSHDPAPRTAPWRRTRRRPWAQPGDLTAASFLFAAIPSLPRAELERLAERVIETMDELDGDPDVEDGDEDRCATFDDDPVSSHVQRGADYGAGDPDDVEDDDPAGGNVEDEGEPEPWRAPDGLAVDRPVYGDDQTLGPINEAEAAANFGRKRLSLWGRL